MYYIYKVGQFLALNLPLRVLYALATGIAYIYYLMAPNDRRELGDNIRTVLKGKATPRLVRIYTQRTFINFAKYLVDFFRFSAMDKDYINEYVTVTGQRHIDKAFKHKKGVIFLSSHIGNWELGGAIISNLGYEVFVLALDHEDKKVNKVFIRQRNALGVGVIRFNAALKGSIKILRDNKGLGILGDRDFTNNGEKIEFFGREAVLPKGPAFFSLRTGAPIVLTRMVRQKNDKYRLILEEPIKFTRSGDVNKDMKALMGQYAKLLEKYIRRYPDQWFVFRRIWSKK